MSDDHNANHVEAAAETSVATNQPHPYKTVLVDMDGVLAEVSQSYREAIIRTCHFYGAVGVTADTVTEYKTRGNANDDWKLSHRMILDHVPGSDNVTLQQVTDTFEEFYQGKKDAQGNEIVPGLYQLETLIPTRETLEALRQRSKPGMGIVTGRPRSDCEKFLKQYQLEDLFDAAYCMEDGPSKPDPFPVTQCCAWLGVEPSATVVLVGDTPDDIAAAKAAGCSAVGVITPEANEASAQKMRQGMLEKGADIVLPPGFVDLVNMVDGR
jgi:HAD superfamily hydrolase (TIGR01548 family)